MSTDPIRTRTSGTAAFALLFGLLALALCWVPLVGLLAFPFGTIALVAAVVGIRRVRTRGNAGLGFAVTGLATGAIGLLVATSLFVVFLRGYQGPVWDADWAEVRELFRPAPR